MKGARDRRRLVVRAASLLGVVAASTLLLASCGTRSEGRTPPADGAYPNAVVEGRAVPMVHVKDHGATVLIDLEGKTPRTWAEQFRRDGELPDGFLNIHKTHIAGHEDFADIPVDRKGMWVIDQTGTLTEVPPGTLPPDGFYPNVTIEGRKVPMIHLKDNGATLLVDHEGKTPRTWAEQFRRHGDVPEGMFNIHKTHVAGHENFKDIPVDRKGIWAIDASGNLAAR